MRVLRSGSKEFDRYLSTIEGRGAKENSRLEGKVRSILRDVRTRGDEALLDHTALLDRVRVRTQDLRVTAAEVKEAYRQVPRTFLQTLERAAGRIRKFHRSQKRRASRSFQEQEKGIRLGQKVTPLERVGIYVPGGKASYPSSVLMAAIPARVAGVKEILMVTPPRPEGISPAVLVAADLAGVDWIYRVGGVQGIAALAYGTASIPKVDKIVGPGNQYVATAKKLVYGTVDIDMVAGPSEIVIIADGKASPRVVAADLLSQAEHDEEALAILITFSEAFANQVRRELRGQLAALKRRSIAEASLRRRGAILLVKGEGQAADAANRIAPEHLEISLSSPSRVLRSVKHAGAIFLGPHTPEAIGDYLAGPNHILPTAGTARFSSPLGIEDFVKRTSLIQFNLRALERFEEDVKQFAEWEGLEGHARAIQVRVNKG